MGDIVKLKRTNRLECVHEHYAEIWRRNANDKPLHDGDVFIDSRDMFIMDVDGYELEMVHCAYWDGEPWDGTLTIRETPVYRIYGDMYFVTGDVFVPSYNVVVKTDGDTFTMVSLKRAVTMRVDGSTWDVIAVREFDNDIVERIVDGYEPVVVGNEYHGGYTFPNVGDVFPDGGYMVTLS